MDPVTFLVLFVGCSVANYVSVTVPLRTAMNKGFKNLFVAAAEICTGKSARMLELAAKFNNKR